MQKALIRKKAAVPVLLLLLFAYANNSSFFAKPREGRPLLLAHRGLAQTFRMEGVGNDTNTAMRIHPPDHPYLENTIPSMRAAFQGGADIVGLDIHPTGDGRFAVFHDWVLEYRTDGTGPVRNHTLAELKLLDIGYGYSPDGGKTFPFRGKGFGLMPSLDEVLAHFPERSFLIHVKSKDPQAGELLARYLSGLPTGHLDKLTLYGGDKPMAALSRQLPALRIMSKATLIRGVLLYAAAGWTGYIPAACRHTELHLPEKFAPWLWGWPNRFLNRMDGMDTRVIPVAGEGEFSAGFDRGKDLERLPPHYTGGIWTNRIDRIAPHFR